MDYAALFSMIILIVGLLAFAVSMITQVIKGIGIFSKIPTDILVFLLSIVLTIFAFVAYMQYSNQPIIWYMVCAAVIFGFMVAFIAMFGWGKAAELWKRFYKRK